MRRSAAGAVLHDAAVSQENAYFNTWSPLKTGLKRENG